VQGIVALALGLFLLMAPSQAWFYAGILAAVYLLVAGAIDFFGDLFSRLILRSRMRRYRGLVGMIFGAVILIFAWFKVGDLALGYSILALGLIAFGGMGLWVAFFARRGRPMRWVPVLINGLLLLWGLAVFFDRRSEVNLQTLSVLVLLVVGAVMVVSAFITRSRGGDEDAAPAAGAAPAASPTLATNVAPAAVVAVAAASSAPVTNVAPVAAAVSSEPAAVAAQQASTTPVTDIAPIAANAAAAVGSESGVDSELTSSSEPKPTGEQP